jgi:hypothetical protein
MGAADRVERRRHGRTGALGMWPVGSRELCRPRTEVEGKLVTESDLSLRAPAQVAAVLVGGPIAKRGSPIAPELGRYGTVRNVSPAPYERGRDWARVLSRSAREAVSVRPDALS